MTTPEFMLDDSDVWDEAGHLAEPALNAIADGELSILPLAAQQHGETCERCSQRVGEIALFALEVSSALNMPLIAAGRVQLAKPRPKLPLLPIAAALGLAFVINLPSLGARVLWLLHTPWQRLFALSVHGLARGLGQLAQSGALTLALWISAAALLAGSIALVRATPLHGSRFGGNP